MLRTLLSPDRPSRHLVRIHRATRRGCWKVPWSRARFRLGFPPPQRNFEHSGTVLDHSCNYYLRYLTVLRQSPVPLRLSEPAVEPAEPSFPVLGRHSSPWEQRNGRRG